jgi:hypothetical protein
VLVCSDIDIFLKLRVHAEPFHFAENRLRIQIEDSR